MKKHGWPAILAALILATGNIGTAPAEIIPPRGEGQIGLQAVVLCETLTVRQQPSASSRAVTRLHYGDQIIVQPETGGWAACFLSDSVDGSRAGWVNEDYLAIDPAWYRTEESTPVYAWDDTLAPKVALLDKNTTLPILKNEGEWLIVSLRGATGWIHQQHGSAERSETGRRDGERFEGTIQLEGMEETVRYEHVINQTLGIGIDYDYENFRRQSESGRERFVSRYDSPESPENYLEVIHYAEDADTVSETISEALSREYDITQAPQMLERAGSCTCINASCIKGTNLMADILQWVYIIPAADGCIAATARCEIESAEGFGVRIDAIMNTLTILNGQGSR